MIASLIPEAAPVLRWLRNDRDDPLAFSFAGIPNWGIRDKLNAILG
jgi:hypothetical protein